MGWVRRARAAAFPRHVRWLGAARWLLSDARTLWQMIRHPLSYGRWCTPAQRRQLRAGGRLWLLVADISHLYIALRFVEELRRRRTVDVVFSVSDRALHRFARAEAAAGDLITYTPVPFTPVLWRALTAVRPIAVIGVMGMRSPQLLWLARRRGIPVAWIDAELSAGRFANLQSFWGACDRSLLVDAVDAVCTRTMVDHEWLASLGFPREVLHHTGPAKYDCALVTNRSVDAGAVLRAADVSPGAPVLLGASLAPGEDAVLAGVFVRVRRAIPDLLLMLAPRDPAHAPAMLATAEQHGLRGLRRSRIVAGADAPRERPDAIVLDTIGELKAFYALARVVFVGRSLTARTGSNLMEPGAQGCPMVVGPCFENFQEELHDFLAADAALQVRDADELGWTVERWLGDPLLCRSYGERARNLVLAKAGAIGRTLDHLEERGFFAQQIGRPAGAPLMT